MAIDKLNLRKVLRLLMAEPKDQIAMLRADIRSDLKRERGDLSSGGDFFVPFWAVAKAFAKGEVNLDIEILKLMAINSQRKRLYPLLAAAFKEWWLEKRASRNEMFTIINENVRCQYSIDTPKITIKIENMIAGKIGDDDHRLIYPYFAESPPVSALGARIGIYLLQSALTEYPIDNFRILDVLRSTSFSVLDFPLHGTEKEEFHSLYDRIVILRSQLVKEYENS